jgi:hypothetical protein
VGGGDIRCIELMLGIRISSKLFDVGDECCGFEIGSTRSADGLEEWAFSLMVERISARRRGMFGIPAI